MKLFHSVNRLPWKYVAGMNIGIVALAITFTSISSINESTENRSQAKEVLPPPITAIAVSSTNYPQLLSPNPSWAKVGDAIVVEGKNLGTKPFGTVKIGEVLVPHENLISWEPNQIVFTVPTNAVTAAIKIEVQTTQGDTISLTSTNPLTITTINQD